MLALWWGGAFLTAAFMGWSAVPWVGLGAVAVAIWATVSGERGRHLVLATGVLICAIVGAIRSPAAESQGTVSIFGARAVRGQVVGGVSRAGGRQRYVLRTDAVKTIEGKWQQIHVKLRVTAPGLPAVRQGDRIRANGEHRSLEAESASYRAYLAQREISGTFFAQTVLRTGSVSGPTRVFESLRGHIDATLQSAAPGDAGALLAGLVTGDDESLSDRRKEAFLVAGLTHVTAISGSNIALLMLILAGRQTNSARQRKKWFILLIVMAIWTYALVVQLEPPVVRASLMATLALVGIRLGRRVDYVTLIVVAAVVMVLVEPAYVRGLSFQLSFVSAMALVVSAQSAEELSPVARAARAVASVAVAHLATLPLVLPIQQQLSLTALPANVIVGPLVEVTFALGMLAAVVGLLWLPAGGAIGSTAALLAGGILRIVDFFGSPAAVIPLWSLSNLTVSVIGLTMATGLWLASGEGRRVVRRWKSDGAAPWRRIVER